MEIPKTKRAKKEKGLVNKVTISLIGIIAILIIFNQIQISSISGAINRVGGFGSITGQVIGFDNKNLENVDLTQIKSTAQTIAALFPTNDIKTSQDAIRVMVPTGTPSYGRAMGVSFDDPIDSLSKLANAQRPLLASLTSEQKQRFINLASKPVGISCEHCCGVGPIGIREDGSSSCGCQHNPALLSVTMWLMQNTDYSDAEILREVMKWKALFFPQKMVDLATKIAGGDTSVLEDLPGMVGGC